MPGNLLEQVAISQRGVARQCVIVIRRAAMGIANIRILFTDNEYLAEGVRDTLPQLVCCECRDCPESVPADIATRFIVTGYIQENWQLGIEKRQELRCRLMPSKESARVA